MGGTAHPPLPGIHVKRVLDGEWVVCGVSSGGASRVGRGSGVVGWWPDGIAVHRPCIWVGWVRWKGWWVVVDSRVEQAGVWVGEERCVHECRDMSTSMGGLSGG